MNRILTPLIAVLAVTSAHATPILTWTGGDYVASAFQQTIGWNFAANQTLQIANLEWYDPTGTNPTQHTVDIWSMDGTLVSSVCVGSGCASSSYLSGFWQTPVSLTLAPGTYDIGGWVDVGDSFLWKGTTVSADPSITYNLPVYIHSTSDLFPGTSTSCGSVGCFGPNFSVAQATPEPGSRTEAAQGARADGIRMTPQSSACKPSPVSMTTPTVSRVAMTGAFAGLAQSPRQKRKIFIEESVCQ